MPETLNPGTTARVAGSSLWNPQAHMPTISGPVTTAMEHSYRESETLTIPQRSLIRWGGVAAAAILLSVGSFALLGKDATAGARGTRSQAVVTAPSDKIAQVSTAEEQAPSEVTVQLFGVPAQAEVFVDGVSVLGSTLHFRREIGSHEIVVSAPGYESFHVTHDASNDGRYAIALVPEKRASKPAARPMSMPRTAPVKRGGLVRTPDF